MAGELLLKNGHYVVGVERSTQCERSALEVLLLLQALRAVWPSQDRMKRGSCLL
jgi:hypothetical protein